MKIFVIILALFISLLSADTSGKSPLLNMMNAIDWEHFGRMFNITGKVKSCKYKDDVTFGVRASLAAPIAIIETTQEYGYSLTLESDLMGRAPTKQGNAYGDEGAYLHVHGYGFNPLGSIMPDTGGALCLPSGPVLAPWYFSEMPGMFCDNDIVSGNMMKEIVLMINPVSILAGLVDCINVTALDKIKYRSTGSTWKNLARLSSAMHFVNGCQGPIPINCKATGHNQISDAVLQAARVLTLWHKTFALLDKTADFGIGPEVWCGSKIYPTFPKAQYQFQIAYPTVGKVHQFGVSQAEFSNFANKINNAGATAMYIWQIRHYSAGGTKCK